MSAGSATSATNGAFARLFDRVAGLSTNAALGDDLLDTAMLRPLGLLTTSIGLMTMSGTALALTHRGWAALWLGMDVMVLIARALPALRAWRAGTRIPAGTARVILLLAFVTFTAFGLGCAASFGTGIEGLRIMSAVAIMGLVAGLATRWAALPRLGALLIAATTLPMIAVVAPVSGPAAALFAVVVLGTGVLLFQNNRHLVGMLRAEREARRLAVTDQLTGLLNRTGLQLALDRLPLPAGEGAQPAGEGEAVALLLLDLDGFKEVNDQHGHAAGDLVLTQVGHRIRAIAGEQPVARVGGDEFVLLMTGPAAWAPEAFATVLREEIAQPVPLAAVGVPAGTTVRVGVSVGIATRAVPCDPVAMLVEADNALYAEKRGTDPRSSNGSRNPSVALAA